jgi:hypothetical protein
LVKVPPEVAIKGTIRPGSVYYFPHEHFSSPEPHFFVVINIDPTIDEVILLICASTKIASVKRQYWTCPDETFVVISPQQYSGFKSISILNCNHDIKQSIDQLVERLSNGRLKLKPEMDIELVERLRQGVIASPIVTRETKELLST